MLSLVGLVAAQSSQMFWQAGPHPQDQTKGMVITASEFHYNCPVNQHKQQGGFAAPYERARHPANSMSIMSGRYQVRKGGGAQRTIPITPLQVSTPDVAVAIKNKLNMWYGNSGSQSFDLDAWVPKGKMLVEDAQGTKYPKVADKTDAGGFVLTETPAAFLADLRSDGVPDADVELAGEYVREMMEAEFLSIGMVVSELVRHGQVMRAYRETRASMASTAVGADGNDGPDVDPVRIRSVLPKLASELRFLLGIGPGSDADLLKAASRVMDEPLLADFAVCVEAAAKMGVSLQTAANLLELPTASSLQTMQERAAGVDSGGALSLADAELREVRLQSSKVARTDAYPYGRAADEAPGSVFRQADEREKH